MKHLDEKIKESRNKLELLKEQVIKEEERLLTLLRERESIFIDESTLPNITYIGDFGYGKDYHENTHFSNEHGEWEIDLGWTTENPLKRTYRITSTDKKNPFYYEGVIENIQEKTMFEVEFKLHIDKYKVYKQI